MLRHKQKCFGVPLRLILCVGLLFSGLNLYAQDREFAKGIIDTLSSRTFAGRGYVNDGDLKAARFIVNKFHAAGLHDLPEAKDFVQPFNFPVNTFPGKMLVKIDDKELIPGQDYIVDPVSGGCSEQRLTVVYFDSVQLVQLLHGNPGKLPRRNFAFAFDKKQIDKVIADNQFDKISKLNPSAIISINDGRLIWSVSTEAIDIPYVEIKKKAIGYETHNIILQIDEKLMEHYTQNIIGYVPGTVYPDSFIFLTAHYDHLGQMGNVAYFPGANDNASGIAMLLDMAMYFSQPEHKPRYSVGFIAFAGEEAGLLGSKFYTNNPIVPLAKTSFLINMDLMANGQDGMTVVNGSVFPGDYNRLVHINDSAHYLVAINKRGKAANSDHYWFTEKGVKAFFVYLLGTYPYYHDIYDSADKPTLAGYHGAFSLIRDFISSYH